MEQEDLFEHVKKFIGIGFIISLLGHVNMSIFYRVFGLNPTPYFDTTEILTYSLKDLLGPAIFLSLLWKVIMLNIVREDHAPHRAVTKPVTAASWFYLACFIMLIIAIFFTHKRNPLFFDLALYAAGSVFMLLILRSLMDWEEYLVEKYPSKESRFRAYKIPSLVLMQILLLFLYSSGFITMKAHQLKKIDLYNGSTLYFNDGKKIELKGGLNLIGKSNKYIIIHDIKTAQNYIYKRDDIKSEKLKKNPSVFFSWVYPF